MTHDGITWQPYREPLHVTVARTVTIALAVAAVLAWRSGRLAYFPIATVLVLWPSFGGHWVEIAFLNVLRPRLPVARATQVTARLIAWFVGGVALAYGMKLTAKLLGEPHPARWPAWWVWGVVFIGIELAVHLVLSLLGRPSFYDGRS